LMPSLIRLAISFYSARYDLFKLGAQVAASCELKIRAAMGRLA
jgi:hypothetical protein